MNKLLILPTLTLLAVACSKKEIQKNIEYKYSDVEALIIPWSDILNVKQDKYLAYVYSETCGHCNEIKQEVISFAVQNYHKLFFIQYFDGIPIVDNYVSMLGKNKIDDLGIVGTPSLFLVENHVVTGYFAGTKEIVRTLTNE